MADTLNETIRTRRLLAQNPDVLPGAPHMAPLIFLSLAAHLFLFTLFIAWPALFPARRPVLLMKVKSITLPVRSGEINPGGEPSNARATPGAGTPAAVPSPAPAPPPDEPGIRPADKKIPSAAASPKASAPPDAAAGKKSSAPAGSEGKPGSAPGSGGYRGGKGLASGGGTGVAFDEDFAQTWYQAALERKIKAAWRKPPMPGQKKAAQIHFVIGADGKVLETKLLAPSGDAVFDNSALAAIAAAQPLPPLPAAYGRDRLGATFQFQNDE